MHLTRNKQRHMLAVAEYMRVRAKDYGVDPSQAYVLGLLHDIGYLCGNWKHGESGSCILSRMGMGEEFLFAVKFHGKNPYRFAEAQQDKGYNNIPEDIRRSSMYTLLLEADMRVNSAGEVVSFEERLDEIRNRYENPVVFENAEGIVEYVNQWTQKNWVAPPPPEESLREQMWDGETQDK